MSERIDVLAVMARVSKDRNGIPALDEARAAVAELQAVGKRVIAAFEAIGNHRAPVVPTAMRFEAEDALTALDAQLRRIGSE